MLQYSCCVSLKRQKQEEREAESKKVDENVEFVDNLPIDQRSVPCTSSYETSSTKH